MFWNFAKDEEEKFLPILRHCGVYFLDASDIEVDELNFQYDLQGQQPRIFNDVITLKSSNPLIRLSVSHAMAQSVKLNLFENKIESTIEGTIYLPQQMAKYGEIKLDRGQVLRLVGELFDLRMNVNLVSNVLDTPELFWSEPELQGLYGIIRGYFEVCAVLTLDFTASSIAKQAGGSSFRLAFDA